MDEFPLATVVDNFSGIFDSVCSNFQRSVHVAMIGFQTTFFHDSTGDFKNPFQTKLTELESTSSFWQNQTDKETIYRRAKKKFY